MERLIFPNLVLEDQMAILNTIQHSLTEVQVNQINGMLGEKETIVHLRDFNPALFNSLANSPADERLLILLAEQLAQVIIDEGFDGVILPLGSPAFMFELGKIIGKRELEHKNLFAHSERKSVDESQPDGSVKKVAVFQHVKWLVL
jgi:hypothetical protein